MLADPNGVGAFVDMGGYEGAAAPVKPFVDSDEPNGVGAFADMGG